MVKPKKIAGISFILSVVLWFLLELSKDMFFGWLGDGIIASASGEGMSWLWEPIFEYGAPAVVFSVGLYFLFKSDKLESNWTLRDAFKYLMLDSKWSIGKRFDPFENSGSSQSPNCRLYGEMTDGIEGAAKAGKIKVWALNNAEAIEPTNWDYLIVDLTTCMGYGESATLIERRGQTTRFLTDAMVNKPQFLSVWPKANLFQKYKDKELHSWRKSFYQREYQHNDG